MRSIMGANSQSRCQFSGYFNPQDIVPVFPRIGGGASESPKARALRINLCKPSHSVHQCDCIGMKTHFAIDEVLDHVEGRIADKWLRINHEPRLSLGAQNVAGVEVRCQQGVRRRRAR